MSSKNHGLLAWLLIVIMYLWPPNLVMRFGIWRRKRRLATSPPVKPA